MIIFTNINNHMEVYDLQFVCPKLLLFAMNKKEELLPIQPLQPQPADVQPIQSVVQQPVLFSMNSVVDNSALVAHNRNLQANLDLEKGKCELAERQLKLMQDNHVRDIEEKEKEHKKDIISLKNKIRGYKKKIDDLKKELTETRKELGDFISRMKNLEDEIARLKKIAQRRQHRLLAGTVAFTYRETAIEYVFGRYDENWMALRRSISNMAELEMIANKKPETAALLVKFKENREFYEQSFDETIQILIGNRNNIAHPISEEEDGEEPPKPARMQQIIEEMFPGRNNKKLRDSAINLVDCLDHIRRELGKEALFNLD